MGVMMLTVVADGKKDVWKSGPPLSHTIAYASGKIIHIFNNDSHFILQTHGQAEQPLYQFLGH